MIGFTFFYFLFLKDCNKNKYNEKKPRQYLLKMLKIN